MTKSEEEFQRQLLSAFSLESEEHLRAISSGLLELEKTANREEQEAIIEKIFRETHSLKGSARAVNLLDIEAVCRSLEDIFSRWKGLELRPSAVLFDILHRTLDTVGRLISSPKEGVAEDLIQRLENMESAGFVSETSGQDYQPQVQDERLPRRKDSLQRERLASPKTVRISTDRLDSLLLQTEQLLAAELALNQRAVDIRKILSLFGPWKKEWVKVYPELRKARQTAGRGSGKKALSCSDRRSSRLLEFLDWNINQLGSVEEKLISLTASAEQDRRSLAVMVDNLLEDVKRVLMLPISTLLEVLPRLVRDLSREQGKEVKLEIRGQEVEVDRRVLEEMKDPLIHMVRNCIDHGIEKPAKRKSSKKPPQGTLSITVSQLSSSRIELLVVDDGAGIDLDRVKEAAVKRGTLSEGKSRDLPEREALSLIFEPGFSTSPLITDISGRGLGLAIVREKVDRLGGFLDLETDAHTGTSFRILLPVTLATFRGVLVRAANQVFVAPTSNVKQVKRIKKDEVKTVENSEVISWNGHPLSLVRLDEVLECPHRGQDDDGSEYIPLLVLGAAEKYIGFRVDEVLNEQEVLVKPLGNQLSRVRNISGATILGSGQVVPILNVSDLMKSAVKVAASEGGAATEEKIEVKGVTILVVEDSITSRMLLKNILEAAGYQVKTAVDGMEAFTALRAESFDLVVSDIEMPHMNGFDLTAKIRGNKKLADIPVVLVTALESRDDRERGIDAGADAYIVKSSFDQSNLLEVVRRLV